MLLVVILTAATLPPGYHPGDRVDAFEVKTTDGKGISLAKAAGNKGLIIIFTSNHCPFSRKYEERINALHARFGSQGLPVLAINPNSAVNEPEEAATRMMERAKAGGLNYLFTIDEAQAVTRKFGAQRTPQAYVLERRGDAFYVRYIGAIDNNPNDAGSIQNHYLEDAAEAVIKGRAVSQPLTQAIGCGVKWSN